jgi:uncharacterized protein YkwD
MRSGTLALTTVLALALTGIGASPVNAASDSSAEGTIRDLIRAERARVCGTRPTHDSRHRDIARWRSADMSKRGYFSHAIPGGTTWRDHLARFGITGYSRTAEIIAWNRNADGRAASARQAYRQFMGSSTHRGIIRNCLYTQFGVGSYHAGTRHHYTVIFTRGATTVTTASTTSTSTSTTIRYADGTVNVRTGPGPQYAVRTKIRDGRAFRVLRTVRDSSGRPWYDVRFVSTGNAGWVNARLTRSSP